MLQRSVLLLISVEQMRCLTGLGRDQRPGETCSCILLRKILGILAQVAGPNKIAVFSLRIVARLKVTEPRSSRMPLVLRDCLEATAATAAVARMRGRRRSIRNRELALSSGGS